jgi:hypothetical protein
MIPTSKPRAPRSAFVASFTQGNNVQPIRFFIPIVVMIVFSWIAAVCTCLAADFWNNPFSHSTVYFVSCFEPLGVFCFQPPKLLSAMLFSVSHNFVGIISHEPSLDFLEFFRVVFFPFSNPKSMLYFVGAVVFGACFFPGFRVVLRGQFRCLLMAGFAPPSNTELVSGRFYKFIKRFKHVAPTAD